MISSSVLCSLTMVCFTRASSERDHLTAPATGGWFLVTGGASLCFSKISIVWSISRANCSRMSLNLLMTCFWIAPVGQNSMIVHVGLEFIAGLYVQYVTCEYVVHARRCLHPATPCTCMRRRLCRTMHTSTCCYGMLHMAWCKPGWALLDFIMPAWFICTARQLSTVLANLHVCAAAIAATA